MVVGQNAAARSVVAVRSANSANPSKGGDAKPGIFREPVSQRPPGYKAPHIDVPEGGIDAAGGSSGGFSSSDADSSRPWLEPRPHGVRSHRRDADCPSPRLGPVARRLLRR